MKTRLFLLATLLVLTGCGLPFNRPAVGPDGTIALFLDEAGAYNLLPFEATLALFHNGTLTRLEAVTTIGDAGALAWSPEGKELVYLETESGSWGEAISWTLWLTGVEATSLPESLLYSEEAILDPAFTPEGDITYLRVDEEGTGRLMRYNREQKIHTVLLENVLSYRPTTSGIPFTVIRATNEGSLRLAHVETVDPGTGKTVEIASFLLSGEMEETLLLFPAFLLWDVDPSGQWLALALYDQVLIAPEVEAEGPSLYLIDIEWESGERLTPRGVAPAFSPDGTHLAYIGSVEEDKNIAHLTNLETWTTSRIPESDGASTLFWIDQETLGLALETEDETYQLTTYRLSTGELVPLLE